MTCAPRCGGTSTSSSYSRFSPSSDVTVCVLGSTSSTLKNVASSMPRSSMIGLISVEALSIVNARFSGDSSVTSLRSRTPFFRR